MRGKEQGCPNKMGAGLISTSCSSVLRELGFSTDDKNRVACGTLTRRSAPAVPSNQSEPLSAPTSLRRAALLSMARESTFNGVFFGYLEMLPSLSWLATLYCQHHYQNRAARMILSLSLRR